MQEALIAGGPLAARCADDAGLGIAHCSAQKSPPPEGQLRYGAHTDSGAVTIASRSPPRPRGAHGRGGERDGGEGEGGGERLDVCDGQAGVPMDAVANCGATLERWTNGRWRAVVHRVQNARPPRLSIITTTPRPDELLTRAARLRGRGGDAPPPVRAADLWNARVRLQRPDAGGEEHATRADAYRTLARPCQTGTSGMLIQTRTRVATPSVASIISLILHLSSSSTAPQYTA